MKRIFSSSAIVQGFLLIESLAALVMYSLIIIPGFQLMSISLQKAQYAYNKTCAMSLAAMQLNILLITQNSKKNNLILMNGTQFFCKKNYRWEITKLLNGSHEFALYTIKIYLETSDKVEASSYVTIAQY